MNTHPSQEAVVEEIISLLPKTEIVVDVGDGERDIVDLEEVLPYELHRILTIFAKTIREEGEARERMRLARVIINASMLDEDEINEEDFDDVSKLDAFMAGVEHVHKAFREALTPTTNHTGETNP